MIKLTGGERRGAKIFTPKGQRTRPALARLRVRTFDVLAGRVADARCADLFAGSGAMGLEALSRGAASCLFVEKSENGAVAIERNLEKLRFEDRARIIRGDVFRYAGRITAVDLVFVDPPYELYRREPVRMARLLERIDGGLYVIEHTPHDRFVEGLGFLTLEDRREFGQTVVSFAVRA